MNLSVFGVLLGSAEFGVAFIGQNFGFSPNLHQVEKYLMEWNIQARAHACQNCKKPFADKELFHTLLYDARSGYERMDVCDNCWNTQFNQGATERKGFVSYWQSVYSTPPPAPPEPIQKETAETLLRKLAELNDPKYVPALYILSAMLERKRILKVKAQLSREGRRVFVYEQAKTGDLFQIEDPNLQLHQLEAVQHEVLHLLQHGLETAPAEATNSSEMAPAASVEPVIEEPAVGGRVAGVA